MDEVTCDHVWRLHKSRNDYEVVARAGVPGDENYSETGRDVKVSEFYCEKCRAQVEDREYEDMMTMTFPPWRPPKRKWFSRLRP